MTSQEAPTGTVRHPIRQGSRQLPRRSPPARFDDLDQGPHQDHPTVTTRYAPRSSSPLRLSHHRPLRWRLAARVGESGSVVTFGTPNQRRGMVRLMADAGFWPKTTQIRSGDEAPSRITGAPAPSGIPVVISAPVAQCPQRSASSRGRRRPFSKPSTRCAPAGSVRCEARRVRPHALRHHPPGSPWLRRRRCPPGHDSARHRDGPTGQTGTGRHLTCSVNPTGTPVGLHSVRRVPDAAVQWSE